MKVLMLCEFYDENLEFQENLLAKAYIKNGHQVVVIASTFESVFDYYDGRHDKSLPTRVYFDQGTKIIKLPFKFNILNRLRKYIDITKILVEESPDLVYIHDIMLNLDEVVAYKRKHPHCRIILDYHGDYSNAGKNWLSLRVLHGVIRKWYLDKGRKHFSRIFPITPGSVKFLNEVYSVPLEEMELLPLGVDVDKSKSVRSALDRNILREKFGVLKNDFVIFTGGKLAQRKKTELLIRAVNNLDRKDVHLFVIGEFHQKDDDYKQEVLREAKGNKNIHFIGWLNSANVYEYLNAADLAVFPASQSIMWQQAIGMALPLIVGDTGKQDPSYLNPYGNMVILPNDKITVECIAKEIKNLLDRPETCRQMSLAAEKVADEMLDLNVQIQKTLRFNSER